MTKKLFILFICLSVLSACNFQQDSDQKQKGKNISYLLNNAEQEKQNLPFHGVKDPNGKINILIVGIDSRGEEQSRSDAIMVAQFNPDNKKGKIVSIMRDSYVAIPGYQKSYNKINTSYYLGGPELLRQTIKHNFDIDVEHFMTIDFDGFVQVVDIVAPEGIEVTVNKKIIDDMGLALQPGVQKLHGKDLLAYTRFRHDDESDFGRVKRQQEVITSLKNEFVTKLGSLDGIFKLPTLSGEMMRYIDTDMDMKTFVSLGGSVLLNHVKEIETMRIPVSMSYTDKTYLHAGQVLELDLPKNKEVLKEFLVDEPTPVNKEKQN